MQDKQKRTLFFSDKLEIDHAAISPFMENIRHLYWKSESKKISDEIYGDWIDNVQKNI